MPPAISPDDTAAPVLVLNAEVWRNRMRALGHTTVVSQARAAGCTRSYLYEMFNGEAQPSQRQARQMVRAANLPPRQLFRLADS